jgi:hypothetical protein
MIGKLLLIIGISIALVILKLRFNSIVRSIRGSRGWEAVDAARVSKRDTPVRFYSGIIALVLGLAALTAGLFWTLSRPWPR